MPAIERRPFPVPAQVTAQMYEAVIGLEVHVQLLTESKLFCGCAVLAGGAPNSRTCPVCLGLPGAMPMLNGRAVELAATAALALGCRVHAASVFARKNYFYPDLPKGYQITQERHPLAEDGCLAWTRRGETHRIRIRRVHLEEDAGKLLHGGDGAPGGVSLVDYNRSGIPLAEIVTQPDLRSPAEAAECFRQLRAILVDAGVSDGNLEAGNLRCDANVSVRLAGLDALGDRTEVKNLNSYRFLQRALEHEVARQTALLESGGRPDAGTRLWNEHRGVTEPMREKEDSGDYRYFPEPDLPPLTMTPERVARLAASVPELPEARIGRLSATYGLAEDDAVTIGQDASLASYFEAVAAGGHPAAAAQWVRGEVVRRVREDGLASAAELVPPARLSRLIDLVERGRLSTTAAKQVFTRLVGTGADPDAVVEELQLTLESDPDAIDGWIVDVLARHPDVVAQHQAGRRGSLGFLVGRVLQASGGRANPRVVDERLRARLGAGEPA